MLHLLWTAVQNEIIINKKTSCLMVKGHKLLRFTFLVEKNILVLQSHYLDCRFPGDGIGLDLLVYSGPKTRRV